MSDKIEELIKTNIYNTPIEIIHANLTRSTPDSMFRSICPACEVGRLMVQRDQKTFKLLAEDYCILCGQHYIYTDIDNLREKAGEEKNEITKNIESEDKVVIPKKVFKYLLKCAKTPLMSHTFMGKCECMTCEALRCFEINDFEDYKWLIGELNDRRNIKINPMIEEEFNMSCKAMKSIGKKIPIDV